MTIGGGQPTDFGMVRIALLIGLLLLGCVPAAAQGVTATPRLVTKGAPGDVDVLGIVGRLYEHTLTLLETEFPDDYAALTRRLAEIDDLAGDERTLLLAAFEAFGEVRRKYADKLMFSPSLHHAVMLGRLADFYHLVLGNEGPTVCGRFARDGSGVLFELGLSARYANALDLQSHAYFEAVVQAIEMPDYAGAVEPDDWTTVFAIMVAAGMPRSYVATIAAGNASDPDLCRALAAVFRTAGLLDTPEGKRTRADFARNLTGY